MGGTGTGKMGLRAFYWRVFRIAFSGKILIAQNVSGLVATFAGLAIWYSDKWGSAVNLAVFLVFLGVFLVLVLAGLVIAPYRIYEEEERKNAEIKRIPEVIGRVVANRNSFTLEEAACLLAQTEIKLGNLSGPSAAYLYDLQKKVLSGEIKVLNDSGGIVASVKLSRQIPQLSSGMMRELPAGLEISKSDLSAIASRLEVKIPGLTQ